MYGYKTYAVIKNENTGHMDIVRFGDVSEKLAVNLEDIKAAGKFVRAKGGFLGLAKEHDFLGRYREAFVSCPGYKEPPVNQAGPKPRTLNELASVWMEQALRHCAWVIARYEEIDGLDAPSALDTIHDLYVFGHAYTGLSSAQAGWFLNLRNREKRAREEQRKLGKNVVAPEDIVSYAEEEVGLWWYAKPSQYVLHYDLDPALVLRLMPIAPERIALAADHYLERNGDLDPTVPINRWAVRQAKVKVKQAKEV